MIDQEKIIFTGGSGLLGGEMKKRLPRAHFPPRREFDVTEYAQMDAYVKAGDYRLVLHAAAFTSPLRVEENPIAALDANVIGTANVVKLCAAHGLRLIYVSTDYVFDGERGNYAEEDPVHPVNKYAWSKLGGECAVRLYDKALIVRTSFGPSEFPYEKAFVDQWTSRESVDDIADKLVSLLERDVTGVIHVGGPRRTVYDYARSLDLAREIGKLSIHDVSFRAPADTSLNCDRYNNLGAAGNADTAEGRS